jgi:hypothetical protein
VIGGWRKLHNGELLNLYSLPSIIRMVTSKRKRARNVTHMGSKRNAYRTLVGKLHLDDIDIGQSIILRWILEREDGMVWA